MLALAAAAGNAAAMEGDVERGRAVVVGAPPSAWETRPNRDVSCLACHGILGAGDAGAAYPRLAGLAPFYMYKQLKDYATGRRRNALMEPIARALGDEAMRDVSVFYGAQDIGFGPPPPASPELLAAGRAIARDGIPERGVQPCAVCHGAQGEGIPPALPALAGQHASYLEDQLLQWKRGQRDNDPLGSMAAIAERLTADEVRAVSVWYATQRPPDTVSSAPPP